MIRLFTQDQFDSAASRDVLPLECEFCRKTFLVEKHYVALGKKRFCSKRCQFDAYKKPRIEVKCGNCGTILFKTQAQLDHATKSGQTRHFCSSRCAAIITSPQHPRQPSKRVCVKCGEGYVMNSSHKSKKCCPTCKRRRDRDNTVSEATETLANQGKHPSWLNSTIRGRARYKHEDLLEQPCPACGYLKHVELCHIKTINSFPKDTLVSVINARENVLPLCRNCHWELDHGQMSNETLNEAIRISRIWPNSDYEI